jgi:pyridoxal phosphate enzyme (YggS family)
MLIKNYKYFMSAVASLSSEVKVVIASKNQSIETIEKLIDLGHKRFGESRVQDARVKWEKYPDLEWHFIGHLQSKKVREVVAYCELIHSVDRLSLMATINKEASKFETVQNVLIQVNTSYEENKSGVHPDALIEFLTAAREFKSVNIMGFMTMAHQADTMELAEKSFSLLKDLQVQANGHFDSNYTELSMGMSSDYELAIKSGASIVRPGRAIFGRK